MRKVKFKFVLRPREEVVNELLELADKYEKEGCPQTAALARQCAEIRRTQKAYQGGNSNGY
jgi:hypothetical protein